MTDEITDRILAIDLRDFVTRHYGREFNAKDKCLCPVHDETDPSCQVKRGVNRWIWHCFGCPGGKGGDIFDLVAAIEGMDPKADFPKVKARIVEMEGLNGSAQRPAKPGSKSNPLPAKAKAKVVDANDDPIPWQPKRPVRRIFEYTDESGKVLYAKVRYDTEIHDERFDAIRPDGNGGWYCRWPKGRVPYRWDRIKDEPKVIVCEGEKDAETLAAFGHHTTSSYAGNGKWPDELTAYFAGKDVGILYDVKQDDKALAVAKALHGVAKSIVVFTIPGDHPKEFDITEYLAEFGTEDERRDAVLGILAAGVPYPPKVVLEPDDGIPPPIVAKVVPDDAEGHRPATTATAKVWSRDGGTLAELLVAEIPVGEILIEGLFRRQEFLYLGGVKHSHKTTVMADAGLHFAAGMDWLGFRIPKAGRFLMIQQELGEDTFRERLRKNLEFGGYGPSVFENFSSVTTTGDPIKISEPGGVERLESLIALHRPDILGLDYESSFVVGGENNDKNKAALRDVINRLKVKYNIGIVLAHHFSGKRPANDPMAPAELSGFFRGHTVLADAADAQMGLHRLPVAKDNPNLIRQFEDYNLVEITLRNGQWPPKFATEFDGKSFSVKRSDVWHELGVKINPVEILDVVDAHGGRMMLKDLIAYFQTQHAKDPTTLSPNTVRKAVDKAVDASYVIIEKLVGRGNPVLVKSKIQTKEGDK